MFLFKSSEQQPILFEVHERKQKPRIADKDKQEDAGSYSLQLGMGIVNNLWNLL